jgi:lipoprotein-anchoring transpeptidase ErfK/SrfK
MFPERQGMEISFGFGRCWHVDPDYGAYPVPRNTILTALIASAAAVGLAGAAIAQQDAQNAASPATAPSAPNGASGEEAAALAKGGIDGQILQAQVLLDRAGFAPGVIDGKKGMSFQEAVKGFQTSRGLPVTGEMDQATRSALMADRTPATVQLRLDESDTQGPFIGVMPKEPEQQAKLPTLGYRNMLEKLAEKFHTTPRTIVALNDPKTVLRAGAVLRLPNVLPSSRAYDVKDEKAAQMLSDLNVSADLPKADKIVVDKSDGVLRLFDKQNRLMAQFPATMGSEKDPLPLGTWKTLSVAYNPPFHYQPTLFWDVADDESEQRMPPGPNGPVGTVWIDLSKEHYGIHGTNAPETIQRAQSHGCVRLTNWDVARVARMVSDGMEVVFQA